MLQPALVVVESGSGRTDPAFFRQGATGIIMKIHFSFVKFKVY